MVPSSVRNFQHRPYTNLEGFYFGWLNIKRNGCRLPYLDNAIFQPSKIELVDVVEAQVEPLNFEFTLTIENLLQFEMRENALNKINKRQIS